MNKWTDILKTFGFFIIVGIAIATMTFIQSNRHDDVMKDSVIVNGKITGLHTIKGGEVLKVELPFNGHTISSTCESTINDSLMVGDSIKLRVSINDPIAYTEYIGRLNR